MENIALRKPHLFIPLLNGKPAKPFSIIVLIRAERLDKDSHQSSTTVHSYQKKLPSQPLCREKAVNGWAEGVGIKVVVLVQKPPYN